MPVTTTPRHPGHTRLARKRKKFRALPGPLPRPEACQIQQWRRLFDEVRPRFPEPPFSAPVYSSGITKSTASSKPEPKTFDVERLAYQHFLAIRRSELSAALRQINTLDGVDYTDDQLEDCLYRVGSRRKNLGAWRDIHHQTRLAVFASVAEQWGGSAFTLLLNAEHQERLLVGGLPDVDWLRTKLTKAFERFTGCAVEFALAVELQNDQGQFLPHVHGVVIGGEIPEDRLRAALHEAGGEWGAAHLRQNQVDLRPLFSGTGWGEYLAKQTAGMAPTAARDLTACTWGLLRAGRDLYAAVQGLYDRLDDARRDRGLLTTRWAASLSG